MRWICWLWLGQDNRSRSITHRWHWPCGFCAAPGACAPMRGAAKGRSWDRPHPTVEPPGVCIGFSVASLCGAAEAVSPVPLPEQPVLEGARGPRTGPAGAALGEGAGSSLGVTLQVPPLRDEPWHRACRRGGSGETLLRSFST